MKEKIKMSLNSTKLNDKFMRKVNAGVAAWCSFCGCACAYANSGGSSTFNNWEANDMGGLHSPAECME